MTVTKKQPPVYGDNLPITPFQIRRIRKLCQFDEDFKCTVVESHTGQTSLKKLTQKQAVIIIRSFENPTISKPKVDTSTLGEGNWGYFDKDNKQHSYIRSLLHQADIVVMSEKWGEVADMEGWFAKFLKSKRSPVQKPLKKMTTQEVSKIIVALEGVAIWKNSI